MAFNREINKKILAYFVNKLGARPYKNGWWKVFCPECGKEKLGFHLGQSKCNCFYCGNKQSPLKFIMHLEGFETKPEVFKFLDVFEGIDYIEPKAEVLEYQKVILPESFRLLTLGNSQVGDIARNYMKKRGFNITNLSMKGIGYCTKGSYQGFIIFPFYQAGKLVYFIGRQYVQLWEKFKNASIEEFGIGKSMLIYNIDSLIIYKKIYLVESITNCLTMGNNAIAILGKKISLYQLSIILRSPVEELVIGLDLDAMDDTIRMALKMVYHKKIKILKFQDNRDINDLGKAKIKEMEKQEQWLNYTDLIKLKNANQKGVIDSYI